MSRGRALAGELYHEKKKKKDLQSFATLKGTNVAGGSEGRVREKGTGGGRERERERGRSQGDRERERKRERESFYGHCTLIPQRFVGEDHTPTDRSAAEGEEALGVWHCPLSSCSPLCVCVWLYTHTHTHTHTHTDCLCVAVSAPGSLGG